MEQPDFCRRTAQAVLTSCRRRSPERLVKRFTLSAGSKFFIGDRLRERADHSNRRSKPEGYALWEIAPVMAASPRLRDLATASAPIFGWESDKPSLTFSQLIVDAETLGRIRALREADNPFKKPISEGEEQ